MSSALIVRVALWLAVVMAASIIAIIAFLPKKMKRTMFDSPEISKILFHPFAQDSEEPEGFEIIETPVDGAILKSHLYRSADANEGDVVIFFHGNGEIAADWFPYARKIAIAFSANLLIADYRGYGLSTGDPAYGNMLSDAEAVLAAAKSRFRGSAHVFGRSIGSAAAIHVAWKCGAGIDSLVIDSGFAHIDALIRRLGRGNVQPPTLPEGFLDNADKLGEIKCPSLFLHGCDDTLIPIGAARENCTASISSSKQLVELPGAGHNDTVLSPGYFDKIAEFVEPITRRKAMKNPYPYGRCPRCGRPLDADGICPHVDIPTPRPGVFIDPQDSFDDDGLLCAEFDLEILAPAKWAGRFLAHLPSKFEMGRYSSLHSPAPGIPFCALDLKWAENPYLCSRRYLRLTYLPDEGFNVELLADNDCKVAGNTLKKGEGAVAKLGDTIEISPDWVFKVVPRK